MALDIQNRIIPALVSSLGILGLTVTVACAQEGRLLSANFGADNGFGQGADFFVCQGAIGLDGIPVVFSEEIAALPSPSDIRVLGEDGDDRPVTCLTFDPADDPGEQRTLLLVGDFGSPEDQPASVEILGDVRSKDWRTSFQGAKVGIFALESGPKMVLAQLLPPREWDLGNPGTRVQWGGGNACPIEGTRQVIRTVWGGGIRTPDGNELTQAEWSNYVVTLESPDGTVTEVTPFALGDLNDRDNNHELCLDRKGRPLAVTFAAGIVVDPNGDLNQKTTVMVSK